MDFFLDKVILWPKNLSFSKREVSFAEDKINVISGGSGKGKSAILAIVDYCFASSKCSIPIQTIRDNVSWFGIQFRINNVKYLIARKTPDQSEVSNEFFKIQAVNLTVPDSLEYHNESLEGIKDFYNKLFNLPKYGVSDGDSGFHGRPSFRDVVSFVFQPQHIIANPFAFFYKADSYEHRERLKNIFPFLLQAVDEKILYEKDRLKHLERELKTLNAEIEETKEIANIWLKEIKQNYLQAREYNLISGPSDTEDWAPNDYLKYLLPLPSNYENGKIPLIDIGVSSKTSVRINALSEEEIKLAQEIQKLQIRLNLIRKLESTNVNYQDSLISQNSRLASLGWFRKELEKEVNCPFCESKTSFPKKYLGAATTEVEVISNEIIKIQDSKGAFAKEKRRLSDELSKLEKQLNNIRSEIISLTQTDERNSKRLQTIQDIYKFLGAIEEGLKNYTRATTDIKLQDRKVYLDSEIKKIKILVDTKEIERRKNVAIDLIAGFIKEYATIFQAENYREVTKLNIIDLTIEFETAARKEALYEIGSGANFMAYHISTLLALHQYFLEFKAHPVPSIIFFDQPSQVYFPEKLYKESDLSKMDESEDVTKTKLIFQVLDRAFKNTNKKLQIIILEHVGEYAWEGLDNVKMIKNWRKGELDNALIPLEWINAQNIMD